MDLNRKNKRAQFLNEKTPELESIRLNIYSRELTLRKAKKDDRFKKYRESQTENLYESVEENIMNKYKNHEKFGFLFKDIQYKLEYEEEFTQCLNIIYLSQIEDEIIICLIYVRKIILYSNYLLNHPGIEEFISRIIISLQTSDNWIILLEILWILSIIVAKNYALSKVIVEKNCIENVHFLLKKDNLCSVVFEQICWLIGNLSQK